MTRINCSIPPKNLIDQHLIAELRELPRIFTAVNKRLDKGIGFDDIPKEFTLGNGHMKFFYNKLMFLYRRHYSLIGEYNKRFKNKMWNYYIDNHWRKELFDKNLLKSYRVKEIEKYLLIDRISTRINESNQIPRYYGKNITKEEAVRLLLHGNILELV